MIQLFSHFHNNVSSFCFYNAKHTTWIDMNTHSFSPVKVSWVINTLKKSVIHIWTHIERQTQPKNNKYIGKVAKIETKLNKNKSNFDKFRWKRRANQQSWRLFSMWTCRLYFDSSAVFFINLPSFFCSIFCVEQLPNTFFKQKS